MANKSHAVARIAELLYGSEDALAAEVAERRAERLSWQAIRDDLFLQSGIAISDQTLIRWWQRRPLSDSLAPTEVESAPAAESAHVVVHPSFVRGSAAPLFEPAAEVEPLPTDWAAAPSEVAS